MTFALFAAPSILLLLLLTLYPLLYAGQQSLRNGDLINAGSSWGCENYPTSSHRRASGTRPSSRSCSPSWACSAAGRSGWGWRCCSAPGCPAGGILKVLLLLPWVVPIVVSATSWNWLRRHPAEPGAASGRAPRPRRVLFLADPTLAKIIVCVFKVWVSFPFMMMMAASALAVVDDEHLRSGPGGRR